jgi:hypothetical protein
MIKFVFRWAFRLLVLAILLVVAGVLLLDPIARELAERRLRASTGMDARIGRLKVGLVNPRITFEDFKLYNTAEFGGAPFIDLPELHVEYDPEALAARKLHFTLVRFHLAEVNIVVNQAGHTNTTALKARLEGQAAARPDLAGAGFEFEVIDTLNFTLGAGRFTDLRNAAFNRTFEIGLTNQVVHNVRSERDLLTAAIIIMARKGLSLF